MQIVRLAMLSLLAVFKDVLPGYRIRLPTEKELAMPVSKDVKKTRDYEASLLRMYQVHLNAAARCWCRESCRKGSTSFRRVPRRQRRLHVTSWTELGVSHASCACGRLRNQFLKFLPELALKRPCCVDRHMCASSPARRPRPTAVEAAARRR